MHLFLWILIFSFIGGLLSVMAAGVYLLLPQTVRERSLGYLVSFATGMLLGAGFLHLLPEALRQAQAHVEGLMATVLLAILIFFLLEKGLIWRHHHHHHHHLPGGGDDAASPADPAATLILIGDSFHNFLDGVLITAAFLADFQLGVVTALAVIAHEVPQELGDFAILLHSGVSRARAFMLNTLTSMSMVLGAVAAWFTLSMIAGLIPYLLAFTAASFIYVAVSDLMPSLNQRFGTRETAIQLVLIGTGLALNFVMHAGHGV